jgi:polysaccharide deacetylase family protein (PEP-CTERM system associated)
MDPRNASGTCVFSIDVEDWFHILDLPTAPDLCRWNMKPSLVERNLHRLLDLLDEAGAHATCFFLGWVAANYPELVRETRRRGHEIASHGFSHSLCYQLGPAAFSNDIERAKKLTEDILGESIGGFRAPGFSVTSATPWFFEKLAEAGFRYDSSIFAASRQHGGLTSANYRPHLVETGCGRVVEFPISTASLFGRRTCFFGGGYLRLFPYWLLRKMATRVIRRGLPLIFYVHPREIDPWHPRLPMPLQRRFKSYVGLNGMREKIAKVLSEFASMTFEQYLQQWPNVALREET